jgi:hypothetical protein
MPEAPQGALLSENRMERKLKPKAEDTRTVEIDDAYTLEFWSGEFNVSNRKLKSAVIAVGTNADDVKRALKKQAYGTERIR